MLTENTQQRWGELSTRKSELELFSFAGEESRYTADAEGLIEFLQNEVIRRYEGRRKKLQNLPLVQEQAFGDALEPDKLDRLARYEVHLDRKLERMLSMLIRLQDLRAAPNQK